MEILTMLAKRAELDDHIEMLIRTISEAAGVPRDCQLSAA
jgi:hypothetical protein